MIMAGDTPPNSVWRWQHLLAFAEFSSV